MGIAGRQEEIKDMAACKHRNNQPYHASAISSSKSFFRRIASFLTASAALMGLAASAVAQQREPETVPGELIVGLRANPGTLQASPAADHSVEKLINYNAELGYMRVKIVAGMSLQQAAAGLRARADVAYVEPNYVFHTCATPNDPGYSNQYAPHKVQADLAWANWRPQAQVIIAIVDTGIDYYHPDLTNKILRYSNGAVYGYNDIGSNARSGNSADPLDDAGHGTHCAGIAAAQVNNGIGVSGIAGWNGSSSASDYSYTKLMPVKVLNSSGSGNSDTVATGIRWAADHGARVISLSLGGGGSTALSSAVTYAWSKGCVIVAAAGNSATNDPTNAYPAAYSNVISVASTDSTDTLSYFSNYGSWVKCAAPGSSIYSTLPIVNAGQGFGTYYGTLQGTSMATPCVAGEAALILSQNPNLTNAQAYNIITGNVDGYSPYSGHYIGSGAGRINVYRALQAAGGNNTTPPPAPTGLAASVGSGQVSLSWNASTGATSYRLKRSTSNGGPYSAIATPGSTAYTDTGLTNGVTYYYVVSATNSAGESGNSSQVAATPAAVVSQLLLNPGFESGSSQSAWTATAGVLTNSTLRSAHSGSWYAWLCGWGTTHTDYIYQKVAIPSNISNATLSYYIHIDTQETTTSRIYDWMGAYICNSNGVIVATLATYSNLNKNTGYAQQAFDLTGFRGQTIYVYLYGSEDSSYQTSFIVDDFALYVK